jgi:hypothetical protein
MFCAPCQRQDDVQGNRDPSKPLWSEWNLRNKFLIPHISTFVAFQSFIAQGAR